MKIIQEKQGQPTVAYISQEDLNALYANREFGNEELFFEESILKGECTDDGYYTIRSESNIRYIESVPFIPNYNHLLKLNSTELNDMLTKAQADYEVLERLLMIPCDMYKQLSSSQQEALKALEGISLEAVNALTTLDVSEEPDWLKAYDIATLLRMQHDHYSAAIYTMYEYRQNNPLQDKSKTFKSKLLRFARSMIRQPE